MASFLVNFSEVAGDATFAVPSGEVFDDTRGTTHHDNIQVAAQLGVTSGVSPTSYAPSAPVTRAQMASFVVQTLEAAGVELASGNPDAFADDDGSVHEANIDLLAATGIVAGVDAGIYEPQGLVTRAQMATFLANAAGHLHDLGLWSADPLPIAIPEVAEVSRHDASARDLLDIIWDEQVTLPGGADGFEVYGSSNSSLVASGSEVVSSTTDRFTVRLDGELTAEGTYWLRVPGDVVRDADQNPNEPQEVAFVFAVAPPDDGGSDAGGETDAPVPVLSGLTVNATSVPMGGSETSTDDTPTIAGTASVASGVLGGVEYRVDDEAWSRAAADDGAYDAGSETFAATLAALADGPHDLEVRASSAAGGTSEVYAFELVIGAEVPVITSVVAEPANGRLRVMFSEPVSCPDTANARASWSFANHSTAEDGTQASGAPSSVTQSSSPSSTCYLNYPQGIEDGDFGALDHAQPAGAEDRVVDTTGTSVRTAVAMNVVDERPPSLLSVSADSAPNPDRLVLQFSEPVLCISLGESDFDITANGTSIDASIAGFDCTGSQAEPAIQLTEGTLTPGSTISVAVAENVYDESQFNTVAHGSTSATTAT